MLAPDTRAVLLDELRPPVGYRLDAAVATTFTLDLHAALVPPLAFASFEMRGTPDPVAALESVRSCADRVDIFCQTGQIRIPSQPSDLMAYLEQMVHEVTPSRAGFLFHPKIWFLRYTAADLADQYRLLCSTRNLTGDRSWDAVVRLDGQRSGGKKAFNRPLAALIAHLPERAMNPLRETRRTRISTLAEDARHIEWDLPDDVRDFAFHTFGIPGEKPEADYSGYRHLIVSPFCNDKGVEHLTTSSPDVTLVSRPETLERLNPETLAKAHTYILNPLAGLADPDEQEAASDTNLFTGLHAKIVVVERNRTAHVFIGSANATSAAYDGNVEFVVELIGGATKIGVDSFLADDTGFRALLEPYAATGGSATDPDNDAVRDLENALRNLAARQYTLTISRGDTGYSARLTSTSELPIPDNYQATAELLTLPGRAAALEDGHRADGSFKGMPLADITPFIALRMTGSTGLVRGTVIRAHLVNDPIDRLDEILARQVNTPEKFLRFLALLLGLSDPSALIGDQTNAIGVGDAFKDRPGSGVLELVMRALVDNPESLIDLDRLVQRLQATDSGRSILPEGFDELWASVKLALALSSEATL
jgi:hypothetical protein